MQHSWDPILQFVGLLIVSSLKPSQAFLCLVARLVANPFLRRPKHSDSISTLNLALIWHCLLSAGKRCSWQNPYLDDFNDGFDKIRVECVRTRPKCQICLTCPG